MNRPSNRTADQLRPIQIQRQYTKYAEGSVLICYGDTRVLCTANFNTGVPRFLKGQGQGWLTAEYGLLPSATHERTLREAVRGKQSGRTMEIQRLIGRSLRSAVDLRALGENTLTIDCDVIQADGGTRTAAITGSCIALCDALNTLQTQQKLTRSPFKGLIAAVSVGIYQGEAVLDLDYAEDANADTDMNVVMTENGEFLEVQGTAEGVAFSQDALNAMLALAKTGATELVSLQKQALVSDEIASAI